MIRHARTAVKFFVYGLIVGLLFSPGSGAENRKKLLDWVSGTIQSVTE
ncbi:MAG: YtxH domain-containing protein [Thermomicrobiales bacterium]|nr:YtxH domain-containing protein [Thermomicrobiales bacterium]